LIIILLLLLLFLQGENRIVYSIEIEKEVGKVGKPAREMIKSPVEG
jgi:hypothetical protein